MRPASSTSQPFLSLSRLRWIVRALLPLLAFSVRGQDATGEPHALGLRMPTAAEEARLRELAPAVLQVRPTARAMSRVNSERAVKGLAPLALPVVPDSEAFVLATAGAARPSDLESSPAAATATGGVNSTPPTAADVALPTAVDNSSLPAFPPVRNQGEIGSCACFSSVYYMSTFTVAQARGLNVRGSGDSDKLSPKFVYNFVNEGGDNGSSFTPIFEVLLKHGAPTWSVWPYSGVNTPASYLEWPLTAAVWRAALGYRMASSYTITGLDTDAGLTRIKTALANGSVLVFGTNVDGWDYATISDDPATPDDNAFVGRPVCKVIRVDDSGHAMTIVGYNDNIWVDLNKNGRVDAGEKGALRIVNSWGTGWKDGGFVWVAYDALRVTSAVSGVGSDITATRAGSVIGSSKPFYQASAYGINARTSYAPQLVGEFTLKSVRYRKELRLAVGRGSTTATVPDTSITPGAVVEQGGYRTFNGTSTPVDGTFVFDFTDLRASGSNRYFVTVRDTAAGDPATLDSFRLLDGQDNVLGATAVGAPVTVDSSTAYAYHTLSLQTAAPAITSALVATGAVNAPFTYVIVASNSPTSFAASNLPAGLSVDPATGAITGTPLATGSASVSIGASNSLGADTKTLALTIVAAVSPPVISSASTASGTSGVAFNYQIAATNTPTGFSVSGTLPNGVTLNAATGLVSGTPAQTGTFSVQAQATNLGGTGSRALTITIVAPAGAVPAISSALTATVDAGNLFNYRIQATGATSFGAQSLPAGLTVDAATGTISGRVSLARTYQVTLTATNANGTGYATLSLEVRGNSSFGPPNDSFATRITISGATVSTTGANTNASAETGEPAHAGSPAATSVWWSWIAPSSGTLTLSTTGSVPAMRSALYTGSSVSALSTVAPGASGAYSVTGGTTYHIAVDSISNATGSIALSLSLVAPPTPRPANDNFASAATLTGDNTTATVVTAAATAETGEPSHGSSSPAAKSVWYKWTASATGICTISTRGSDYDTLLAIYTGSALNALTLVVRDDDGGGNTTSQASFVTTAGATYNIAIDGYAGAAGNAALSLAFTLGASAPTNDNFAAATILTGSTATNPGVTVAASRESGEPAHAGYTAAHSVWFRWTAPSNGLLQLSTIGSSFDTVLAVYTGSALGSLLSVASDDDSGGSSTSLLSFNAVSGTTYYFAVDGYHGASGNYVLNLSLLSGAPANDAFAAAATLTAGVRATGVSTLATAQSGEPQHFAGTSRARSATRSLWWTWTAPATGFVSLATAGSAFDTILSVYTGSALNALTLVAENDDAAFGDSTSNVFFRAVAGRTYLISVDGYSSLESGAVVMTLTQTANPSVIYATDFEHFATGAGELVNYEQWTQFNASSSTNAQGILPLGFTGQGRAAYLGYGAPSFTSATSSTVFVYRPLNFDPVAENAPVVQFRTDFSIIGSTNGLNDVFSIYLFNRAGSILAGMLIDPATRRLTTYDGGAIGSSSLPISFNTRYTVVATFNFTTHTWNLRINSTDLVTNATFGVGKTADVGDFDFTWSVLDSQRRQGDNFMIFDNLSITADAAPTAAPIVQLPAAALSGALATSLSYSVTAANGPILFYSASGLPAGLSFNTLTGLVSGTPTQSGTFNVTFTATNARGQSAVSSTTFTIAAGPPSITSGTVVVATLGQPFAYQIQATNSPRRFDLRGTAALPSGLGLDAASGLISGTPAALGRYQVTLAAENDAGVGTALLDVTVSNTDVGRLVNLSILTNISAGDPFFTVGAVVGGSGTSGTKPLLIRAAGPSLAQLGVGGALADPKLDLFSGQTVTGSNDNWGGTATLSAAFTAVGAFAYSGAGSRDAALYNPTQPAGAYTIQVSGVGGATGTVIAELYDATPGGSFTAATPRLVNVSVLKRINLGETLTAGFVIGGSTSKTILIRAVGPTLGTALGIPGSMPDPRLDLYRGQVLTNSNNDWGGSVALATAFTSVGAFALSPTSQDAALLVTLAPGNYSAQVSGFGTSAGLTLVEVYEVP